MTIPNAEHFFEQAERLISPARRGAIRQVDIRRSISNAYYALFHALLTGAADEFVGRNKRASVEYALAYRSIDHRALRDLCAEVAKPTLPARFRRYEPDGSFGADLKAFAAAFGELQQSRHEADYDPLLVLKRSGASVSLGGRPHGVAALQPSPGERSHGVLGPAPLSSAISAKGVSMQIELICTGDEVLTGKIVNTNFSYIAQKLEDVGLSVRWGTTVGDDRDTLLAAFVHAGERADAVIVNGGLGPTVDDLSQEIAAQAAGDELVLNEQWLTTMEAFFARRSRVMSPNNRKQAMLPRTSEILDNPIGTACGFAMDIGKARFFFTPGVPREVRRMLEDQVLPRLLALSGRQTAIRLKRFHSYGLGESHVDQRLHGVEDLVPDGSAKLGFRAHYPQIETKLTVRGADDSDIAGKLGPVVAEVRRRLGNFILAEDDDTLEGVILTALRDGGFSLAVVETFTSGQIAARFAPQPGAESVFRRGIVARQPAELWEALRLVTPVEITRDSAAAVAQAARRECGASHALAVLIDLDDGPDRIDFGGTICLAIATETATDSRRSRILGGREWVRLGAVELGLDCLRRHLHGLPVTERIDFERT